MSGDSQSRSGKKEMPNRVVWRQKHWNVGGYNGRAQPNNAQAQINLHASAADAERGGQGEREGGRQGGRQGRGACSVPCCLAEMHTGWRLSFCWTRNKEQNDAQTPAIQATDSSVADAASSHLVFRSQTAKALDAAWESDHASGRQRGNL